MCLILLCCSFLVLFFFFCAGDFVALRASDYVMLFLLLGVHFWCWCFYSAGAFVLVILVWCFAC